jgi:hypothetical protein
MLFLNSLNLLWVILANFFCSTVSTLPLQLCSSCPRSYTYSRAHITWIREGGRWTSAWVWRWELGNAGPSSSDCRSLSFSPQSHMSNHARSAEAKTSCDDLLRWEMFALMEAGLSPRGGATVMRISGIQKCRIIIFLASLVNAPPIFRHPNQSNEKHRAKTGSSRCFSVPRYFRNPSVAPS